ncbi:hypothetical protein OG893_00175 [Streptomyces sp. NBC_01696]|uniref:hypothetical protein n=1 Tax=Streptomyces sp. NBC_01696 TaxID=2975913 RepID=UPI002E3013BF|nr:hypothetical protein [Streptomyces sp. NBC_01696]
MLSSRVFIWQQFSRLTPAEVLEVIPLFHPLWEGVDPADLVFADERAAHGNFRAWAKGFYLYQCAANGVNDELRAALATRRLPTQADRDRALLGHVQTSLPANPLAPKRGTRNGRHPKMLPDGARAGLLDAVNTARDVMVVTWLSDTSMRIGALTGLHLVDLHLRDNAACGDCIPR